MPQVKFRTVTGTVYSLDVPADTTVAELKQQLETKHGISTDRLKLILTARILNDAMTVRDINIPAGLYIVIHHSGKPPAPAQPEEQVSVDSPSRGSPGDPPEFPGLVETLCEMGFPRAQAETALRAGRFDVERATNLILSGGVPEPGAARPPPPSGGGPRVPPRYRELQSTFESLEPGQRAAVERLSRGNLDAEMVLQIYIACECNEATARELLG
jgi:hypothetical protein